MKDWKLVPLDQPKHIRDRFQFYAERGGKDIYRAVIDAAPSAPTEALNRLLAAAQREHDIHSPNKDKGVRCICRFCDALRAFALATSESGKEKE